MKKPITIILISVLTATACKHDLSSPQAATKETIDIQTSKATDLTTKTIIGNQQVITLPTGDNPSSAQALLYLPDDYATTKKTYPLIIFLPGTGEQGPDISSELNTALPQRISQGFKVQVINPINGNLVKFMVVSPQGPANSWGWQESQLAVMLRTMKNRYRVDSTRVYVTGLSAGGWGTWTCVTDAVSFVKKIAAVAPVSPAPVETSITIKGVPDYDRVSHLINAAIYRLPVWIICGEDDSFWGQAQNYAAIINAANPIIPAKLTGLPGVGHSAWDEAYDPNWKIDNMNLYQWFLQYHRK